MTGHIRRNTHNWMNYYKEDGVKAQGVALAYGVRF
jgi:hypothetical protein